MGIAKIIKPNDNTPSKTRKTFIPDTENLGDFSYLLEADDKATKKKLLKFVAGLKSYIRGSDEYSKLMKYLKDRCGVDRCGNHPNISHPEFQIQIHHYPFVTEDIVYTVLYKRFENQEPITYSGVADEYMRLHYLGLIGLYGLCETCHEFNHSESGDSFIPEALLYGDPVEFFNLYQDYMTERLKSKFNYWLNLSKGYSIIEDYIPEDLIKEYLYITDDNGIHYLSATKLQALLEDLQNS